MGIRVNKVLGYGIRDFKGFDTDNRVSDSVLNRIENDDKYNSENFKQYVYDYLKKTDWNEKYGNIIWNFYFNEKCYKSDKKMNHFNNTLINCNSFDLLYKFMIYDDEYKSSILLFTNPLADGWKRHDDTIDYYEEDCCVDEKVKPIKYGIYPYNSVYNDIRTGDRFQSNIVRAIEYIQDLSESNDTKVDAINNLLENSSFKDYEEYKKYCNVVLPEVIVMYLDFIEFFNKDVFNPLQLSPMLYS